MREVLPEAWELVEHGHIDDDFRAFTSDNPLSLWAQTQPGFFAGTAVVDAVACLLAAGPVARDSPAHPVDRGLASSGRNRLPDGDAAFELFRARRRPLARQRRVHAPWPSSWRRPRMLQGAVDDTRFEILEWHHAGDPGACSCSGSSGGTWGRWLCPWRDCWDGSSPTIAAMDIMVVGDDRVQAVWAISDFFTPLVQAGVVGLR